MSVETASEVRGIQSDKLKYQAGPLTKLKAKLVP